jgi:hypothetical protein
MQLLNLAVAKWLGQFAPDIGADARRNRRDTDGSVAHGMTFDGGDADGDGPIDSICWLHDGRFKSKTEDALHERRSITSTS